MVKFVYIKLANIAVGLVAFMGFAIPMVILRSHPFDDLEISAADGASLHERASRAVIFDTAIGAVVKIITPFVDETASAVFALRFFVRVAGVYPPQKNLHSVQALASVSLFRIVFLALVAEKTAGFTHEGGHRAQTIKMVFSPHQGNCFALALLFVE